MFLGADIVPLQPKSSELFLPLLTRGLLKEAAVWTPAVYSSSMMNRGLDRRDILMEDAFLSWGPRGKGIDDFSPFHWQGCGFAAVVWLAGLGDAQIAGECC